MRQLCLTLPSTLYVERGQVESNSVSNFKQPLGQLGVHRLARGGILSLQFYIPGQEWRVLMLPVQDCLANNASYLARGGILSL